jgi:hypothetical protein
MRFSVGDVVGIDVVVHGVPVHHVGLVSRVESWDDVFVISNSKRRGCVVEEHISEFAEGGRVAHHPHIRGALHGHAVVHRARSRLGHTWDLITSNCEHFVRWAHGLPEESPQLVAKGVVGVAAVGTVATFMAWLLSDE